MDIKTARAITSKKIVEFAKDIDPTGYNAEKYRKYLASLSNEEFIKKMTEMYSKRDYNLHIDAPIEKYAPTFDIIKKVAKKWKVQLHMYVKFKSLGNKISATKLPILYVLWRTLQQIAVKKNYDATDVNNRHHLTGQVIDKSKGSGLTDMETAGLMAIGQEKTVEELLNPRGDNIVAFNQMQSSILENGRVSLKHLDNSPNNKQSYQLVLSFIRTAGFDIKLKDKKKEDKE